MCESKPVITVYTSPGCGQCEMTKKYLTRENTDFNVVDFTEDEDALTAALDLGYRAAPVVFAKYPNGSESHWQGFRPDKLSGYVAASRKWANG